MTSIDSDGHFSAFYRANYSVILATVARRLSDRATAEDVTSEVFRVAWAHHVGGDELTLPWLYTVARNVVGNEYRRSSRSAALTAKSEGLVEIAPGADDDSARDTRRAMMRLKEADREILFMAYWEDLTGAEIAAILDCKVPTVWVRLNRARAALKHELKEKGDERS
jgi:RNA polymerase sigma factor (sigma-70 family)